MLEGFYGGAELLLQNVRGNRIKREERACVRRCEVEEEKES
jgi:hypothetical protein